MDLHKRKTEREREREKEREKRKGENIGMRLEGVHLREGECV